MKSKGLIIFLVIIIVLSGFGREFIMKNINWVLKFLSQGGGYWAQPMFDPLLKWSIGEINVLKWSLTILFTLYFYLLTYLGIKISYSNNKYMLRVVTILFTSIVGISFFLYALGWLTESIPKIYDTVRNLMGLVQSFIPFMLLYLVFKFMPQKKRQ